MKDTLAVIILAVAMWYLFRLLCLMGQNATYTLPMYEYVKEMGR